jgi:ABC-type nickel/cobalt efflux system permease component RcnA
VKRAALALLAGLAVIVGVLAGPAAPASAHPLGNFSVNQYEGLTLRPDRVEVAAVVDVAEIPTMQERSTVDTNRDGMADDAERAVYAAATCAELGKAFEVHAGRARLAWAVGSPEFSYVPGASGLPTSRLACALSAPAKLGTATTLTVTNHFRTDRVGWRELTAVGDGVRLVGSPLPARSVSNELRSYPADLLSSSLDVRSATLNAQPEAGAVGGAAGASLGVPNGSDPVTRWMAAADRGFQRIAGGRDLTPAVAALAILVSILLGAGHAALPGHGKTVLAAYLAGRQGRPRDAVVVGATVTLTHTGGVLLIGLLLSTSSALAGDRLLGWLGLASGVLVTAVGIGMVVNLLRRRGIDGASHAHAHSHSHDHGHAHSHAHGEPHGHSHSEPHGHAHPGSHGHSHAEPHTHGDGPHQHHPGDGRPSRWSLAGIGIAGGLVPSPSALVVLLGAIGLGRAGFGVLLVVGYGLGMAGALTGAGLLLVLLQRRVSAAPGWSRLAKRFGPLAARVPAATSTVTAGLVVVVGLGLAARAAAGVL